MRKVFSSQRLENVEAVAELLRADGIEVKIENGRSWKGYRRGNFSYDQRKASTTMPAVWIVRAEDQPRGRQRLRELGLLESTRESLPSFLPHRRTDESAGGGRFWSGKRIRIGLLVLLAAGIGLIAFTARKQERVTIAAAPAPPVARKAKATPAPPVPEAITQLEVFRIDTPRALVKHVVDEALANRKPAMACLEVDGKDPSADLLAMLTVPKGSVLHAASQCPATGGFAIAVHDYLTDGSGSGQVQLDLDVEDSQLLDVERRGEQWRVLRRH